MYTCTVIVLTATFALCVQCFFKHFWALRYTVKCFDETDLELLVYANMSKISSI